MTILLLRASYLSRIYEKFDSFEEALSMVCRIYEEHLFLPFQTMSFSPARFAYKFEDLVWFIRDFEEFGLLENLGHLNSQGAPVYNSRDIRGF